MLYILAVAFIVALDRFTKVCVEKKLKLGQSKELIKGKAYLRHVKNKGAAFGFLSGKPRALKILSISSILMLIYYSPQVFRGNNKLQKSFLSMVIGGAIGNLYDRHKNKSVTDFLFIKFKNAPIFNIADIFIFLGSLGIFFDSLKNGE
ncbi:MAG: signal peptidase II [Clostridiales bacterium]|nr:signal peptidase II [Clostridiales bacterium]